MVEKITIRVYRRCVEPPFFRGIVRWNVISGKKKSCLEFCLKEFYKKIKVPRVCVFGVDGFNNAKKVESCPYW